MVKWTAGMQEREIVTSMRGNEIEQSIFLILIFLPPNIDSMLLQYGKKYKQENSIIEMEILRCRCKKMMKKRIRR